MRIPTWLLPVILLGAASNVGAQVGTGTLSGDVLDQAGAAVAGATITVVDVRTGRSRPLTSDDEGRFAAPGLSPGPYLVRVDLAGFRPLERHGVRLLTGETLRLSLQLEVGAQSDTVTVTADASLLRSDDLRPWSGHRQLARSPSCR